MTAAVQEPAGLERLLGTVGDAMTGAVVLLAADMPAGLAPGPGRAGDAPPRRQPTPGNRPVRQPLGILTRDDVLRAVAGSGGDRYGA